MDKLLRLLSENSDYSPAELALMLDETEENIIDRIRSYEKQGIIKGHRAIVDFENVEDSGVTAYIELKVTPLKEKGFDEVAFHLSQGEISHVFELEDGYHILKCIDTLDREKTDRNKLDIIEARRNEVFGAEYDGFVETLARRINKKAYEELDFLSIKGVRFPNFFDYGLD